MSLLQIHVALSLLEIPVGLVAIYGLLNGAVYPSWTALFLVFATLNSLTGFPLPPFGFDPPRAVGVLTLVLLAAAAIALYVFALKGAWRWIYIVTATMALYLDVFVGVIQSFENIPALEALAPTQSEPPFVVTQAVVLVIFIALGVLAVRRFHPALPASS
jgi:hypothetical protein